MISPVQLFWIAFSLGLLFGSFPFLMTLKDFLGAYFAVRFGKGKRLLFIHRDDGIGLVFRSGYLKDGLWQYKNGKNDIRSFTVPDGSTKRLAGVWLVQLPENVTAPFCFKHVVEQEREVTSQVLDNNGLPVKDKEGNFITESRRIVESLFFKPYNDAMTIMSVFENALSKKASRSQLAIGAINFKSLLIIAVVVIGAWFVIKNFVLTGQAPDNVIP